MKKLTPNEEVSFHIKTWREADISWTKEDLEDLERLYKWKAPEWAYKEAKG